MNELTRRKARLISALTDEPVPVTISGDCMAPLLQDGDRVLVRKSRWYAPGDILVYTNSHGNLISHRMLGYYYWKGEWRLLIKADNARQADGGISADQIVGRVLDRTPDLKGRLTCMFLFARLALNKVIRRQASW